MRHKKILKWTLRILAALAAGIFLLLLLLVFALRTQGGRDMLADFVQRTAASPDLQIHIADLQGALPFAMQIGELTLADSQGVWLRVKNFDFDCSALALLTGTIHINRLTAGAIDFLRPPVSTAPQPEPEPSGPVSFALPSIPPVVLKELRVDALLVQLAPDDQKRFRISGECAPQDENFNALLDVRQLTDANTPEGANLQLKARLDQNTGQLALNLAFDDPAHGLVGAALGGEAPVHARLQGHGPLQDWRGALAVNSGDTALFESDLALSLDKAVSIGLDGVLRPPRALLPPDILPLLGDTTRLSLKLALVDAALELRTLHIKTKATEISGNCRLGPAPEARLAGEFSLRMTDTAPLKSLAQLELAAPAVIDVALSGTQQLPEARLTLRATKLRQADLRLAGLDLKSSVRTITPLAQQGGALQIDATLQTTETFLGDKPVGDGNVSVALKALVAHNTLLKDLHLDVRLADASITAAGRADMSDLSADLNARVHVPNINGIIGGISPVQGGIEIRCAAKGDTARGVKATLNGSIEKLQGLPPDLALLLGSALKLDAEAFYKGAQLDLKRLNIAGNTALSLAGSLETDSQTADLALTLRPPQNIDLEKTAGVVIRGISPVKATLAGKLAAPKVRLDLAMQELVANGNRIDHPTLRLDLTTPVPSAAPKLAPVSLEIKLSGQPITFAAQSGLRLEKDGGQTLLLRDLSLSAPGAALRADLDLGLADLLAKGDATLQLTGLKKLGLLAGMDLSGSGSINVSPGISNGKQSIRVQGTLKDIAAAGVSLQQLALRLQSADIAALDKASGQITLSGVRSGNVEVDKASIDLSGAQNSANCTLKASGKADKPFTLALALTARQEKTAWDLALQSLQAQYADFPVRLASPTAVRINGRDITFQKPLALKLAKADFKAAGALTAQGADMRVNLEKFDLASLASIVALPVKGVVSCNARLTGGAADPALQATLALKDLLPVGDNTHEDQALDIDGDIRVTRQKLDASMDLSLQKKRIGAVKASLPVEFGTAPLAFAIPPKARLAASARLGLQLKPLTPLFMPPGQSFSGRLDVNMQLHGPLEKPQPEGTVRISDGMYENIETGTIINNLLVELEAKGMQMRLAKLAANDGGSGRISGSGSVLLDADKGMPFDFKIALQQFTGLRMDLATSKVSGEIEAKGGNEKAEVNGKVIVDEGVVNIPSALPPGVTDIDVQEVGVPGKAETAAPPQPQAAFPLALDIDVRIPDHFFVRGQGLQSEWGGDLHVYGSAQEPRIKGKLNVTRGHLDFMDWRFVLDKGNIIFSGETPPSPYMEIVTSAKLSEITARITLDGSPADLKFALSSEPALPENEILARLIFKKSVQELTPMDAIRLAIMADSVAGGQNNLDGVVGGIQNVLGLDTLGLGQGTSGSTTLEAGTYVSDRVYVKGQKGLSTQDDSVSVEVEVTPQIGIEGEVGADSQSGVGLNWKFDY